MIIIITGYCLLILDLLLEKEYLNIQPCDLVGEMRPLRHVYVEYNLYTTTIGILPYPTFFFLTPHKVSMAVVLPSIFLPMWFGF